MDRITQTSLNIRVIHSDFCPIFKNDYKVFVLIKRDEKIYEQCNLFFKENATKEIFPTIVGRWLIKKLK